MARLTGLEPATPGVTGRYSNQLSYNRAIWVVFNHSACEGQGGKSYFFKEIIFPNESGVFDRPQ